jgi:RNA polymerase sigma factor (sigma-70 family)
MNMNQHETRGQREQILQRKRQQNVLLKRREEQLRRLAEQGRKKEFFDMLMPLLGTLRPYVERRLRVGQASGAIRPDEYSVEDIIDEALLKAYENFDSRSSGLSLEEWLYQLANETLEKRLKEGRLEEKHSLPQSFEEIKDRELRGLEEVERMTGDAEREVILTEDLDPSDYSLKDFVPPHYSENELKKLIRKETVSKIIKALSRVPLRERLVFELYAIEGFSKKKVAEISGVPPEEVPRIVKEVRSFVFRMIKDKQSDVPAGSH